MKTQLKKTLNPMAFMLLAALTYTSCDSQQRVCPGSETRAYNESGFTRVDAGENFKVTIRQDDAFSIQAEGCTNDLDDLVFDVDGDELTIRYRRWDKNRHLVELDIAMPQLKGFSFSGAAKATVMSFDDTPFIDAELSGASEATFNGQMEQIDIEMSGAADFELGGTAAKLDANISGSSRLRAYPCQVQAADIDASGGSKAWITVDDFLKADISGGSRIYYRGNPGTDIHESGGGKAVRE